MTGKAIQTPGEGQPYDIWAKIRIQPRWTLAKNASDYCSKRGIDVARLRRSNLSPTLVIVRIECAIALHEAGNPPSWIAEYFNVSPQSVRGWVNA